MLFDLRKRGWSVELCRLADLPPSLFPAALPSASAAGTLTAEAANVTGLPAGLPVVIGGHDHICAALAAGAVQPGIVLDSAGTAEVLLVTLDQPALAGSMASSGLCCGCHTARDRYYLMAGVHGGGTLGWVSRVLAGDDSPSAIASLMEEAAASPLGANGVRFVPYLSTSGPPERDPNSWGAWLGLHLQHTRADLARAVVEGVSFAIRYLLEVLVTGDQAGGVELRCVGGGTRNTFWQQVKADVIGAPIDAPATADFTALGAALLAGIGVGVFSGEADAIQRVYRSGVRYTPDPQRNSYYNAVYQREFPRLRSLYKQISIER
jgi:xylulokinase